MFVRPFAVYAIKAKRNLCGEHAPKKRRRVLALGNLPHWRSRYRYSTSLDAHKDTARDSFCRHTDSISHPMKDEQEEIANVRRKLSGWKDILEKAEATAKPDGDAISSGGESN